MKKLFAILLVLVLIGLLFVQLAVFRYRQQSQTAPIEYKKPYNVVVEERIEKQVEVLKTESLQDSLQTLVKMDHYLWPGSVAGFGDVVIISDEGRYQRNAATQNMILSSRVFRKCFQELSHLPSQEASSIVKDEIATTLSDYLKSLDEFNRKGTGTFQLGEGKDGKPVLTGLRCKLFALVLIAGSLEQTDLHNTISDIVKCAVLQRVQSVQKENEFDKLTFLAEASIYNVHILCAGLYGTSSRKNVPEMQVYDARYKTHNLVDFSAAGTEYDVLVREGFQKATADKEYLQVRYFESAADDDVDELIRLAQP